ncbi:pilS cassette [Neisseria meningitidis]|nr:pilS cassette [Neisseria meningitidis]RQJ71644.1 pilS cassette [Neisseria meningitidis]RQJ72939.1 pilS cassette [Neisseria meningitidis]RQJ90509.1 pilS cassette [Neisseria meningitidis]RQJ92983.1 pilS cassette [Neisseria meningitidis]
MQAGIQTFKPRTSPINSCGIEILDSRFHGNDGGGFLVFPINAHHPKSRYSHKTENQKQQSEIPSFPPVRESDLSGFGSFSRFR